MTQPNDTVLPTRKVNPLTIVASVLYLAYIVFTILPNMGYYNPEYWFGRLAGLWDSFAYSGFAWGFINLYFTFDRFAFPVLGIAAAVIGLVSRKPLFQLLLGASLFVIHYVLNWVLQVVAFATDLTESFYFLPDGQGLESWLLTAVLLAGIVLSGLVWLRAKSGNSTPVSIKAPAEVVKPQAATIAPSRAGGSYANLPLFALIGAFIVPLAGIILGHLSLSYMKKGQLSTQNKGMATAGLILGYVFVGLGFLTGLILVIVLIVSAVTGY